MSFGFFADAGLTIPFTVEARHFSTQGDRLIYFGSPASGQQLQDSTNPGVTNVQVTITDSDGGAGLAAASIKLASTSGNAKPVHMRFDTSAGTVGTDYTDLGLAVTNVIESAV
jgi:hypothetical protein